MLPNSSYRQRRAQLVSNFSAPLLLTGHTAMQEKSDMTYPFTQEPSFYYLTGINEADWQLFFDGNDWVLVKPSISDAKEVFDGSLPADEAIAISGIAEVIGAGELKKRLAQARTTYTKLVTLGTDPMKKYYDFALNPAYQKLQRIVKQLDFEIIDCRDALRKMRALKTEEELVVQRQAIDVTVATFKEVKLYLEHYKYEYEIEARFNAAFREKGGGGHAYSPIVAGGRNACTLHYQANQAKLPDNGLVLLDIGAKVGEYAADITRTYAFGTPSERERAVHAAVEAAHFQIIALINPGVRFTDYQKQVDAIMTDALVSLGLMKNVKDTKNYRKYFPHAIGHGLGIDVHESLGGYETFQEGMVLTVEPGIYIPEEGIGVRIEDNILVTHDGNRNLSADLPTAL